MFGFIVCFETESKVATINGCKVQDGRLIGCAAQPFTDLSLTLRLWCGALAGLSATELFELVLSNRLSTSK
nr:MULTISPECIES: hypothetical protein [unclassified Paenibacillus]